MTTRSAAAGEVQRLVGQLCDPDPVVREAAVARLRILGSRAVLRLAPLVSNASAAVRAAALKALEGIDDARVPRLALRALDDSSQEVRLAAMGALRPWILRDEGARIIEALVPLALDRDATSALRLAALDALSELPREVVQPVIDQTRVEPVSPSDSDDPATVQQWLAAHAEAPLSELHALIARLREREQAETAAPRRREWLAARGAIHAVLARRRSRVALYDLREAFDAATAPLPLDFLTAAATLGDATCLEPLARAWSAAPAEDAWWRARLAETAAALVRTHGLTGRHAAVKRVRTRWPGFL